MKSPTLLGLTFNPVKTLRGRPLFGNCAHAFRVLITSSCHPAALLSALLAAHRERPKIMQTDSWPVESNNGSASEALERLVAACEPSLATTPRLPLTQQRAE